MLREEFLQNLEDWLLDKGIYILLVILGVVLLRMVLRYVISRVVKTAVKADKSITAFEEEEREQTVIAIINSLLTIILWSLAVLLIVFRLGVDFAPLIVGASALGLIIGFGAQDLVKDALAGFYIIVENQYNVGDIVEIGGVSGTVQKISIRSTVLRDLDGYVHHVANGKTGVATNKTSEFSRVNINLGVDYNTDIDKVEKVINKVGSELALDKNFADAIEEAPTFRRVSEFTDSAMILKIVGKTLPGKQWKVAGEFRKRIKIAFDKNGIEIPYPRVINMSPKKK
ncbi:MAG: mechanosensitive ion channel family protein [bacterium]|nr:mechanosensitive ion channel family protein [bacterium]